VAGSASAPVNRRDGGRIVVEVAVESVTGARAAQRAGADRIELCQSLFEGGLTPSLGLLKAVREAVDVPVFAMLRPRAGDFLYDDEAFDVMQRDAALLLAHGADGLVFGVLRPDGAIDRERTARLIERANGRPVTFHRAFDLCADAERALDELCELGVARLLTSGQAATASEGAATIRSLVQRANGRLSVMAGAGVRDHNVAALVSATGVGEVHLSAAVGVDSGMRHRRADVPMGANAPRGEYELRTTDEATVARTVAALRPPAGGARDPQ